MQDTDWAYFAGIVDGEGSVSAYFFRANKGYEAYGPRIRSMIRVSNTNRALMDWLVSHFGGNCGVGRIQRGDRKTVYRWEPARRDVTFLLEGMLPYLQVKRAQAELLLELDTLMLPRGAARKKGVPPANFKRRVEIVEALRLLNMVGTLHKPRVTLPVIVCAGEPLAAD